MDNISYFFILTYANIYVLKNQIISWFYLLKIFFIFSNTLVLTSSIDVVFILSIKIRWFHFYDRTFCNAKTASSATCTVCCCSAFV